MFMYINMGIETVQQHKKNWVETFVSEQSIKNALNQFVDAQTAFTKQIVKSGWDISGEVTRALIDKTFNKR